jgi:HAD superfamily hydrolase (TIGR01549 family)
MTLPQAVLFDLDGVLIDTRDATRQALAALASQSLDRIVPAELVDAHMELRPADALAALGVPDAVHAYETSYDAALSVAVGKVRAFAPAIAGMVELFEHRVGLAVVTAQPRRRLPLLVPPLVADLADVVLAGDDVTIGKPDPEGILAALDTLGVQPERALYVGDTPVDLMAAWRAGVVAVGAGWGYAGADALHRAGAEVVLTHPRQVGVGLLDHLHRVVTR